MHKNAGRGRYTAKKSLAVGVKKRISQSSRTVVDPKANDIGLLWWKMKPGINYFFITQLLLSP